MGYLNMRAIFGTAVGLMYVPQRALYGATGVVSTPFGRCDNASRRHGFLLVSIEQACDRGINRWPWPRPGSCSTRRRRHRQAPIPHAHLELLPFRYRDPRTRNARAHVTAPSDTPIREVRAVLGDPLGPKRCAIEGILSVDCASLCAWRKTKTPKRRLPPYRLRRASRSRISRPIA
jgi:hypothetical protein